MNRRGFIKGLALLPAAPLLPVAAARVVVPMPIRSAMYSGGVTWVNLVDAEALRDVLPLLSVPKKWIK